MHVSLHGPDRWAFSERGRGAVSRGGDWLQIGPSSLHWDGGALHVTLDERAAWNPLRLRGTMTVRPQALTGAQFTLDPAGRHLWSPVAPRSRVDVALSDPAVTWQGHGYFDANAGAAPLEQDFDRWHWSCARLDRGAAAILYDTTRRDGTRQGLSLHIKPDGSVDHVDEPPVRPLRPTLWRIPRETRSHGEASVIKTLLDSPFYARSVLNTDMMGERVTAMHESLDMNRFTAPWVQAMLPFRVARGWA